jgi:hypothetical protein
MDGTVYILSVEVISRQVEILNCERTLVGLAVGAQGIGLDRLDPLPPRSCASVWARRLSIGKPRPSRIAPRRCPGPGTEKSSSGIPGADRNRRRFNTENELTALPEASSNTEIPRHGCRPSQERVGSYRVPFAAIPVAFERTFLALEAHVRSNGSTILASPGKLPVKSDAFRLSYRLGRRREDLPQLPIQGVATR